MAENVNWKKISDKKYQRLADNEEWVSIDVPYGKVESVFAEFIGNNGLIDPTTGMVKTDLATLIGSFGSVGDIVLSEYDAQGNVSVKGSCRGLAPTEVPPLFEIATDIINSFISAISAMQGVAGVAEANGKTPRKKVN